MTLPLLLDDEADIAIELSDLRALRVAAVDPVHLSEQIGVQRAR